MIIDMGLIRGDMIDPNKFGLVIFLIDVRSST